MHCYNMNQVYFSNDDGLSNFEGVSEHSWQAAAYLYVIFANESYEKLTFYCIHVICMDDPIGPKCL